MLPMASMALKTFPFLTYLSFYVLFTDFPLLLLLLGPSLSFLISLLSLCSLSSNGWGSHWWIWAYLKGHLVDNRLTLPGCPTWHFSFSAGHLHQRIHGWPWESLQPMCQESVSSSPNLCHHYLHHIVAKKSPGPNSLCGVSPF